MKFFCIYFSQIPLLRSRFAENNMQWDVSLMSGHKHIMLYLIIQANFLDVWTWPQAKPDDLAQYTHADTKSNWEWNNSRSSSKIYTNLTIARVTIIINLWFLRNISILFLSWFPFILQYQRIGMGLIICSVKPTLSMPI